MRYPDHPDDTNGEQPERRDNRTSLSRRGVALIAAFSFGMGFGFSEGLHYLGDKEESGTEKTNDTGLEQPGSAIPSDPIGAALSKAALDSHRTAGNT